MTNFSSLNDYELTRALRDSDDEAFRVLFFRYYKPVYTFLWTRIRSVELARDIVQDVFSRLWIHRHTLNPDRGCKAYLFRIADRLLIDHFRKQSSQKTYKNYIQNKIPDPFPDPDLQITLQNAINTLPDPLRQVFLLSRYEGYTYQEIAKICRISVKTVESRMTKAFKKLRNVISAE